MWPAIGGSVTSARTTIPSCGIVPAIGTGSGGTINYANVLAWIKSGPQTLPSNLQSGRVVYYSSIPSDVTGGTLDAIFWKNYIDFVFGYNSYQQMNTLYGMNGTVGQSGSNSFTSAGGQTYGPFGPTPQITAAQFA